MVVYYHLTSYLKEYIYSQQYNNKYLNIISKKIFNILNKMSDNIDNSKNIKKLIINITPIPIYLKNKVHIKETYITDNIIIELLNNYINDGGENNFQYILNPDSEEDIIDSDEDTVLYKLKNYNYYD